MRYFLIILFFIPFSSSAELSKHLQLRAQVRNTVSASIHLSRVGQGRVSWLISLLNNKHSYDSHSTKIEIEGLQKGIDSSIKQLIDDRRQILHEVLISYAVKNKLANKPVIIKISAN